MSLLSEKAVGFLGAELMEKFDALSFADQAWIVHNSESLLGLIEKGHAASSFRDLIGTSIVDVASQSPDPLRDRVRIEKLTEQIVLTESVPIPSDLPGLAPDALTSLRTYNIRDTRGVFRKCCSVREYAKFDMQALAVLPGVGPATAEAIVAWFFEALPAEDKKRWQSVSDAWHMAVNGRREAVSRELQKQGDEEAALDAGPTCRKCGSNRLSGTTQCWKCLHIFAQYSEDWRGELSFVENVQREAQLSRVTAADIIVSAVPIPDDIPEVGPVTLAVLRRNGLSTNRDILISYCSLQEYWKVSGQALEELPGVGPAKASSILAWFEDSLTPDDKARWEHFATEWGSRQYHKQEAAKRDNPNSDAPSASVLVPEKSGCAMLLVVTAVIGTGAVGLFS